MTLALTNAGPATPAKPGAIFSDNDWGSGRMASRSSDNRPLCGAEPSAALRRLTRTSRGPLVRAGVALSLCGTVAEWLFKSTVVAPAFTPLQDGGYGELFGPVSLVRLPVYALCGGCIAIGAACIGLGAAARGGKSN
jgi:hypothetical protein